MIPRECKRLAEVDFPIAAVSQHAVREKRFPVPRGLPSTLHHWWARRPLASSRAMLLALLLPDPCDPHCPPEFKKTARRLLPPTVGQVGPEDDDLRGKLLKFIGEFAAWKLSANGTWLSVARALVKAAHPEETPQVVDPFAGGGSIPLEALRLGCETFASDLNPVACLILKAMLEDIPRHGPDLIDALDRAARKVKATAEKELAPLYPRDPDGTMPIVYLWARTVSCEATKCGAEIPLARSFWLSKKAGRKQAIRAEVVRRGGEPPRLIFEVFQPKTDSEVAHGTIARAIATCPCCGTTLGPNRVREQLANQRGGGDVVFNDAGKRIGGAVLLAVATAANGKRGRNFRMPEERDYKAVWEAEETVKNLQTRKLVDGSAMIPDEPLPPIGTLGFRIQRYGMASWGDLFTARQKATFATLSKHISQMYTSSSEGISRSAVELLALALNKVIDFNASLVRWRAQTEDVANVFGRQALPMVFDFTETNPFLDSFVGLDRAVSYVAKVIAAWPGSPPGQAQIANAVHSPLPDGSCSVWFPDPPYYDAIPYSDISDFFFVWLKRTLPDHPLLCDPDDSTNPLTPKTAEIVQDKTKKVEGKPKDKAFFEEQMALAFAEGRRVLHEDGIGGLIFAHKTTEGWEALLSGLIRGGWTITGSWPIATEQPTRLRARESAVLDTSVHLVCRPRPDDADVGEWTHVQAELPRRVSDWMERLQEEGIRGADLIFACIGPALEIFSRHASVETAAGNEVGLAQYLERVWEVVGRAALEQVLGEAESKARNGLAGALEEDARLTALFLWTLQSSAANGNGGEEDEDEEAGKGAARGYTLIFDVVRRFAQSLGIHLETWERRIIRMEKGMVRLLPVRDRARQLFGEDGVGDTAASLERDPQASLQGRFLFPDEPPQVRGRRRMVTADALDNAPDATTLDRVHAAMLLQDSGRSGALRNLIAAEQKRGPDFLRLANALSALYPRASQEKRLLDAMLLAAPR